MLRFHRQLGLFCIASALAAGIPAQAPVERYELGLRLREFERNLASNPAAPRQAAALRELDAAVQAFFGLDLRGVARAIERAEVALLAEPPAAGQRFARSLQMSLGARLVAPAGTVTYELTRAFDDLELPSGIMLEIVFAGAETPALRVPVTELPTRGEIPLQGLPTGDGGLAWRITAGGEVLASRRQGLSVAADVAPRLARLAAVADSCEQVPARDRSIEQASLAALVKMLQGMTRKRPEETVLPGASLLAEAENLAGHLAAGDAYYSAARTGQHWLRVPLARGTAAVRFAAPAIPEGERRPIVVALHGAGGSENLFFDGYGDGLVARLAAERGWFVAAPRSGGFAGVDLPQLVEALAGRWPIDTQRIFVVGHSMGAAQAIAAAGSQPERFTAVAALGGGGAVARKNGLERLPFFVGVGERDFARKPATQLHRQLVAAGARSTLREYPDVEHLAIVQFALPDVFGFFDAAPPRR